MTTLAEMKREQEQRRRVFTNPTCAGCGAPIRPDYWQPQVTSLCPVCEVKTILAEPAWAPLEGMVGDAAKGGLKR